MRLKQGKLFNYHPQPYPRALRKSVLPLWLYGHIHSLWYSHLRVQEVPVRLWGQLRQDLLLCTGVFQGKRRKELLRLIFGKKQQIANIKQRFGDIVRGYGYPSLNSFMKIYRKVEADYADYFKHLKEWGDKYGMRSVEEHFEKRKNLLCLILLI
jgi:hypothetical protein